MRFSTTRYPVDRYLVESSKQFEMVNIIDDDIWKSEPALKPEDEIILRKLHEMLQSTADDLKLLSGELSKFHEPGVQVKTQPTPLDEEFNEKVHIEEVVNAKFHGYTIIDKHTTSPTYEAKDNANGIKTLGNNLQKPKVNVNVNAKVVPMPTKPVLNRNLGISRTKLIEINDKNDAYKNKKMNSSKVIHNVPAVAYNEFCFEYVEPKVNLISNNLKIQEMPSINIRSELKEQKVLQLDIIPNAVKEVKDTISKNNIAVIFVEHETQTSPKRETKSLQPTKKYNEEIYPQTNYTVKQPIRKISKMSAFESSGSTNNVSSDTQHNLKTQKQIKTVMRTSPKNSARVERKKGNVYQKELEKRTRLNLDKWKKKLSVVYGKPSTSRNSKITPKSTANKASTKKSSFSTCGYVMPQNNILNNAEYIPYSQLTLGGVRVSDIEREISDMPNKNAIPLSPILDRILTSRENSFQNSPRKNRSKEDPKIFTTSDENLLQEVIDIERTVSETISKNLKKTKNGALKKTKNVSSESYNDKDNDSYADDFEDEVVNDKNSLHSDKSVPSNSSRSEQKDFSQSSGEESDEGEMGNDDNVEKSDRRITKSPKTIQNKTYTKSTNLSFKKSVDVYEYVHCVDVQDTATQSNTTHKISLKETQTSPTNDRSDIEPIHNDLWPSIDPKCEVEKIFKLEKDFIKKLIMDEYGDLIEKNINKPSTSRDSKNDDMEKNVTASQKNTQTSPAHVKNMMTSPKGTKTRTTSPFLSVTVDHQTSPMIVVTNDKEVKVEIDDDDLGISINLSSPRFSLRLPQTSREVLTNLEECTITRKSEKNIKDMFRGTNVSSSSSVDGDKSSSEISSLGEVKLKLKRRLRKNRVAAISESSSSSTASKYSSDLQSAGILPLKSEGEVSSEKRSKKVLNRASPSEGETSLGALSKG